MTMTFDYLPLFQAQQAYVRVDLSPRWNTRATTGNDATMTWRMLVGSTGELYVGWDVLQAVGSTVQIRWINEYGLSFDLDPRWFVPMPRAEVGTLAMVPAPIKRMER